MNFIKISIISAIAFAFVACGGNKGEKYAKITCDCYKSSGTLEAMAEMKKMTDAAQADPTKVDAEAMKKAGDKATEASKKMTDCLKPMTDEVAKEKDAKKDEAAEKAFKEALNKNCPEVAKAIGM